MHHRQADEPLKPIRENEHVSQRKNVDMSKLAGRRQCLVHSRSCLIDVTQLRQSQGEIREHRRVRIEGQSPKRAMLWVGEAAHTPLQERAGGSELAKKEATRTVQQMAQRLSCGIVLRLADLFELLP